MFNAEVKNDNEPHRSIQLKLKTFNREKSSNKQWINWLNIKSL